MSETRLRIMVACGAAGGIAATFNAPLTGLFFGFELILREFSVDAMFAVILSAVTADLISRAFFGAAPFFTQIPHGLTVSADYNYLLIALLGLLAGLIGVGFKTILYKIEDLCDQVWKGRPEWARPAVGGLALGAVLLALPEMYGVGYPVMDQAVGGHIVLWLLLLLTVAKMGTASLTIGIGGSGGVFAPSLFTGAMAGTAFGVIAHHVFGPAVGSPAIYGVVAMGAVFAAAAQAPLTAIASVVEMTGNFALTLPIMLAVGIAAGVSKRLTYGTIYTTKLLRRGTDIERPRPASLLQALTVADTMQPLLAGILQPGPAHPDGEGGTREMADPVTSDGEWTRPLGTLVETRDVQALFADETLEHALRQLVLYGPDGLPVLAADRSHIIGWITSHDVLHAMARRVATYARDATQANMSAEWASADPAAATRRPAHPAGRLSGGRDRRHRRVSGPRPAHRGDRMAARIRARSGHPPAPNPPPPARHRAARRRPPHPPRPRPPTHPTRPATFRWLTRRHHPARLTLAPSLSQRRRRWSSRPCAVCCRYCPDRPPPPTTKRTDSSAPRSPSPPGAAC